MRADDLAKHSIVTCQRQPHRFGVPFPKSHASLDIGEHKGDGSGRSMRHGITQRGNATFYIKDEQNAASKTVSRVGANVAYWPIATVSAPLRVGRLRGRSGHRADIVNRSLVTQLDRWRQDFGATQQRRGHLLGL